MPLAIPPRLNDPASSSQVRHLGGGLTVKDTMLGDGPAPGPGRIVKIL